MYRLVIKRSAERDLRRLPRPLFLRINRHILSLQEEPHPPGARKLNGSVNGWRLRVGDYRVPYLIDAEASIITIVRARHRRYVYGP
jgi:mRNA interferase RelE/StbE